MRAPNIATLPKLQVVPGRGGSIVGRLTRAAYQSIFGLHELTRQAYNLLELPIYTVILIVVQHLQPGKIA
jgi:hypothetical protein